MAEHKAADRLRERALTRGEVSLAQLHRASSYVLFGAALSLMSLSLVSIYWALALVGMPAPLALLGALALEGGMAYTAHTATTVRKPRPPKRGQPRPDGYFFHLWLIYCAVTLLAQAANVWHAMVSVADFLSRQPGALPHWMPESTAYWFAGAFAMLFPLGGTLFIHVSGFLRVRGAGADWIDPHAESVRVRDDTALTERPPRAHRERPPKPRALTGRTLTPPVSALTPADEPRALTAGDTPKREQQPEPASEVMGLPERERARLLFAQALKDKPGQRPDAAAIRRAGGITAASSTVRRWVSDMWDRHQVDPGSALDEAAAWDELAGLDAADRVTSTL